ncbi:hypothetical protein [Halorubrum sp. DTA98]|uniref:hypothetical protein n=1 Tax=Halorubrum sp. DTA98 TaxID=3402163 RepID=UPI003AAA9878
MQRTRRRLLGAAFAAGVAGCVGTDGVEYPEEGAVEGRSEAERAVEAVGDDGDAFETDDRDNEELADATRRVVDDALWFATEYEAAIATYRDAIGDVVADVDEVRDEVVDSAAANVEFAERLEASGFDAAERAADALEPHFRPRNRIENRTERHVERLRTFAERGDVDRFLEEIDRMRTGFSGIRTRPYIEDVFSRDPIHNRLLRRLLHPLPDDADERRVVYESTLVEVGVASEGFTTLAKRPYDDDAYDRAEIPRLYGDPIDSDRQTEIRARFGPVVRPDDRTAELFFVFATRPQPNDDPEEVFVGWPHDLNGTVVYVQRYPDVDTARDRLNAVTTAGSTEDAEPIDPETSTVDGRDAATHWHRLLHHEARGERYGFDDHAGVQYGYVTRAGEFLLATGFSGDAWEERLGWQGKLANGWAIV